MNSRSVLIEEDILDAESEKLTRNIARMGTVPIGRLTEFPKIYPIDANERAAVQTIRLPINHGKKQLCVKLALLQWNSVVSAKVL